MKTVITTISTEDYFQHYLPLYIYILRKEYPEYDVKTFIKGKTDELTKKAFAYLREHIEFEDPIQVFKNYGLLESTINCLRFLVPEKHFKGYDYVIFTDLDLLIFRSKPTLLNWHLKRMKRLRTCYAGHRGPKLQPHRPEISFEGWVGRFKRVAAGFFMATPEWFKRTKTARARYKKKARCGKLGGYREMDEVMLARILKESKLPVPPLYKKENFKIDERGIHLGDFKYSMKKRYESLRKMRKKVTNKNIKKFYDLDNDPIWQGLIKILCKDPKIKKRLNRATEVLENIRKKK